MLDIKSVKYTDKQKAELHQRIQDLSPWYHSFDFGDGVVTEGKQFDSIWDMIKRLISQIDYTDKTVLDLASWDGYWAFNAEKRGAKEIVSSDVVLRGFKNLLFCKEVLQSKVIPLCNVPVQHLSERLNVTGLPTKYDIIHHFGLFYHLRDPMQSLTQARLMIEEDGLLLLETAMILDNKNSYMAFSGGIDGKYHFYGQSDTWAPTTLCMTEMLLRSGFKPVMEDIWQEHSPKKTNTSPTEKPVVSRAIIAAKPFPLEELNVSDYSKFMGTTGCQNNQRKQ